jgi:hypothetical protein
LTLIIWSGTGVLVYGGMALWLLRLTHVPWSSAFRSILQFGLYACLPGVLLYIVIKTLTPNALWLVILTAVAALSYYTIVLAKDHSLRDYLLALLPKNLTRTG